MTMTTAVMVMATVLLLSASIDALDTSSILCNETACGSCTPAPDGLKYSAYVPSARVTRFANLDTEAGMTFFNFSDLGAALSIEDATTSGTYLNAVVLSIAGTLGFTVLLGLTFLISSIFRCFNYCSGGPGSCCGCCCCGCHPTNPSKTWRWVARVILFILLAGAGALAYFSTDTAKNFNDGISSIGQSFEFTSQWISDVGLNADLVLAETGKVNASAITLGDALQSLPSPFKDNAEAMVAAIQASVTVVEEQASMLNELLSPLSEPLASVEDIAALGPKYLENNLAYALYGLCGLFGLLVILVMSCTCPFKCCSPTPRPCKCFLDLNIFVFVWIILIMWIVSLVLQMISSFLADVCQDPDSVVLGMLGGNEMAEYYVTCAGNSPFADAITTINTEFDTANDQLEELEADPNISGAAGPEIVALKVAMGVLKTKLLLNDDAGEPVCGLFHETDCAVVNARYQALINGICGGFMEPLSMIFETFISLAAALSILEIMRRLIPKSPLGVMMKSSKAERLSMEGEPKKKTKKEKKAAKKKKQKKKKAWDDWGDDDDYDAFDDMDDDGWGDEMNPEEAFTHRNSWNGGGGGGEGDWDDYGQTRETHFSPGVGRDSPNDGYSQNKNYY
eukprot:gene5725-26597_t